MLLTKLSSDILHPGHAGIAKNDLRERLSQLYKASAEQVSVFGLRTHFGGGKTSGFALVYDSVEALKKFEPRHRLVCWIPIVLRCCRSLIIPQVRVGLAVKPERASRQQRTYNQSMTPRIPSDINFDNRQATQEPYEDPPWHREGQGREGEEGQINGSRTWGHDDWALIGMALAWLRILVQPAKMGLTVRQHKKME